MKLNYTFLFILLAGFCIGLTPAVDPDLFWHLKTGQWIVEQQQLPYADMFSFSVPGRAWVGHEWLTQIGMYFLWVVGDYLLLSIFFGFLFALSFALLSQLPEANWLIIFVGIVASFPVVGTRPQIFTIFFLSCTVYLLWKHEIWAQNGLIKVAPLVPLLFLWSLMHGGFPMGFVYVGAFTVLVSKGRDLLLLVVALMAVVLFHPYSPAILTYSLETLSSHYMATYIQEWHPPDATYIGFWAYVVLAITAVGLGYKRFPIPTLLLLGFIVLGITSARHIPISVITTLPLVMACFNSLPQVKKFEPQLQMKPLYVFAFAGLALLLLALTPWRHNTIMAQTYPITAVEYLKTQENVRLLNDYDWGGYLIWEGFLVFVDGRADVYGDEFLMNYVTLVGGDTSVLDPFNVNYALLKKETVLGQALLQEGWQEVYQDDLAVIYQRP